jgi:hypothetical protein
VDAKQIREGIMKNKTILYFAVSELVIGITAMALTWYWFGWRVSLLVFLYQWAHNLAIQRLRMAHE